MLPELNPPQREAVTYLDGPLLVLAGAGSGKTRVIAHKIVHIIKACGFSPANVAAITFTNKAAREMQERVSHLLEGTPGKGLTVSTFHSLGLSILRQECSHVGYKPKFSVLDSADAMHILSEILQSTDRAEMRRVQQQISLWKNDMRTPGEALQQSVTESEHQIAQAYQQYQDTLHAYQAMDFDDLILLPARLFQRDEAALTRWQSKLRYLLVDEYQDTNLCQYRLLRLLAGPRGMFTAVGDDDQAIYAWRGASSENIRQLQVDFPALHVVKLEQNYRSTLRILRSANHLIANNPKLFDKRLWSELGLGDPIHVQPANHDEHEAETVVMRLQAHKFENRTRFSDYAILYRGNHQARVFEQALRNERIPYQLSGGSSFFDKAEIKDITAWLRLLANDADDPAFIRAITTPKRGIGLQTLEKLGAYAAGRHTSLLAACFESGVESVIPHKQVELLQAFGHFIQRMEWRAAKEPAGDVLRDLLTDINYENWLYDHEEPRQAEVKWKNVGEFLDWITRKGSESGKTLIDLAQTIALINILESRNDEEIDAVRLSTLHAAKGLEYPHVFLVGVEEGVLPHKECLEPAQVEEERRLMYVGITRAQRSLTITFCRKRRRGKEWQACEPSRFIAELPQEDLNISGGAGKQETRSLGNARLDALKSLLNRKPE